MAGWFAWLLVLGWLLVPLAERSGVSSDRQKVQGTWQAVSIIKNGKPLTDEEVERIKLIVKGDTHTWEEGTRRFDTEVKLDPEAQPKALDEKYLVAGVTIEHMGIYRIDGDRFEMCLNLRSSNPERPTDFSARGDRICYVFRRVKL
jgi:uncharacterized protein (TIGR03067 family)